MIDPEIPGGHDLVVKDSTVRAFSVLLAAVIVVLFRLRTPALVIALLCLVGAIAPAVMRPVFITLMAITSPIGHVMSMVVLGVVYYMVLTPLAWVFRMTGRDVLRRRRPESDSYWQAKTQPSDPKRYLRPYQR